MRKNVKKQEFRTYDLFLVLSLVGAVFLIVLTIIGGGLEDPNVKKVQRDTEALIGQLLGWEQGIVTLDEGPDDEFKGSQRELASSAPGFPLGKEGIIGLDPWGQAYRFQVVELDRPHSAYLLVWSNGPNARNDSGDQFGWSRLHDQRQGV
ncbi:MAG: hypothetical protein KDD43_10580, partial [Bdellovibrionales bacterium]|nr:hypothetical protein [Bdellovibrionales bacterium]